MPPFRAPSPQADAGVDSAGPSTDPPAVAAYRQLLEELASGTWDRAAWEEAKDLDHAPFRARAILIGALEEYARAHPAITFIPTAAELESRYGPYAFSDSLFIDHLHFNFAGQRLLAELLARAIVERLFYADDNLLAALTRYFAEPERIRADIHLTDFWEFEAYTRVISLQAREPFASMPLPKSVPEVPDRVMRNALFRDREFLASLEGAVPEDLFFLALDRYRQQGNRDEWIRNLNAYIHLFAGHYQSHLAYGVALLEDDVRANLDPAGSYIRRAYYLSGRNPGVVEIAREALVGQGAGGAWESFRARFLE
jgi:hypothetical protein